MFRFTIRMFVSSVRFMFHFVPYSFRFAFSAFRIIVASSFVLQAIWCRCLYLSIWLHVCQPLRLSTLAAVPGSVAALRSTSTTPDRSAMALALANVAADASNGRATVTTTPSITPPFGPLG
jgi:hypothetical protein